MINVSVIGATGYAGAELVRLLLAHPEVKIAHLVSQSSAGGSLASIYPSFAAFPQLMLEDLDTDAIVKDSDIIFTSLPHGASGTIIPSLFEKGGRIIDLSGDFRYNDASVYESWYKTPHPAPHLLCQSVYGLCELHRSEIKSARLVGNPGCYTTCAILALTPAIKAGAINPDTIIIDSKSGVSGAGRKAALEYGFCEVNENAKAYGVATHRHTSEIEQELSLAAGREVALSFTPHLIPVKRGILTTAYASLTASGKDILQIYKDFYKNEPFVRVLESGLPELKHVNGSNMCHIGLAADARTNRLIVVSALDNLIKGAGGQAIQNMNIMCGIDETCGLLSPAFYL